QLEAQFPAGVRDDVDAVRNELLPIVREDDVRLAVQIQESLDEQQVGTAGRGREADAHLKVCKLLADLIVDCALQLSREARRGATGAIDHVPGKDRDARYLDELVDRTAALSEVFEEHVR